MLRNRLVERRNEMTGGQIIRAWKDEDYRRSLTEAELSALPENPAGLVELDERSQGEVGGATGILCEVVIASVSAIISNTYTRLMSCFHCPQSIDAGGTCGVLTSGCC
jgi:mersacidin/lichenicidin family type 2 lantibiotic